MIYDKGLKLLDTWRALERLVDEGRCKAIGLSDVSLDKTKEIFEAARIKPAVVHVESHPYLPQWELLDYCKKNGIVFQAFAALGHSSEPNVLQDPVITAIAKRVNKTPAQVLLAWAIQRGTALLTTSEDTPTGSRRTLTSPPCLKKAVRGKSATESSCGSDSIPWWRLVFLGSFQEKSEIQMGWVFWVNIQPID